MPQTPQIPALSGMTPLGITPMEYHVADKLRALGIKADAEHTGGGIICIYVETLQGFDCWGTANETWGADKLNGLGEYIEGSTPISIACDSEASADDAAAAIAAFYA